MRGDATQAMSQRIVEERQRSRCPPEAPPPGLLSRSKCQVKLSYFCADVSSPDGSIGADDLLGSTSGCYLANTLR